MTPIYSEVVPSVCAFARLRRRTSASTAARTKPALSSPGRRTSSRRAKVPSTNRATIFSINFFGRAMRSGFDQLSVPVNAISPGSDKGLASVALNRYLLNRQYEISPKRSCPFNICPLSVPAEALDHQPLQVLSRPCPSDTHATLTPHDMMQVN